MPHIGGPELIIILLIVMMLFGVGKLPEIGGAIGKGYVSSAKRSWGWTKSRAN